VGFGSPALHVPAVRERPRQSSGGNVPAKENNPKKGFDSLFLDFGRAGNPRKTPGFGSCGKYVRIANRWQKHGKFTPRQTAMAAFGQVLFLPRIFIRRSLEKAVRTRISRSFFPGKKTGSLQALWPPHKTHKTEVIS
jgi:hypothetical protein